jgi:O-antigen ligase
MAASGGSRSFLQKLMCLGLSVPPLVLVVRTGSRGGMAALLLGLFVYLYPYGRRAKTVQRLIATVLVAGGIAYAISNDSVALSRWTATLEEGSLAGRENIFPVAAEMALERPLLGWGPIEFFFELGQRTGRVWKTVDAHNLLLHLMLEVGVVGTVPFLVGIWLCARAAWKGRSGEYGLLPLSLMVTILVVNMSVVALNRKPMWLVLALALSAHKKFRKTTRQPISRGYA